ncbi:MAG: DegT/DnrJ/EryC1/StrS family aminotransferase [Candidatus Obscuribacterales bacterium]|nr:DegT/DnrJ/EryC1/StrS family aminotransferase [Candidatus Obscuribacterales bacterium]
MTGQEMDFLGQVIESGFLNDGPLTEKFEAQIAEFLGVPYAVALTSCTAGLYLSLMALGIGHGDEVLVPDITFIATANAVKMTGAEPVLVDVDLETFCISADDAKKKITNRTKAVIPVHVTGRPSNIPALLQLCKEHTLHMVEDAAEALGSASFGGFMGTHGITGCFSLSPAKTITTGQGGLIITKDATIHGRLRELKDQGRPKRGTGGDDVHSSLGFNFKFTDLQSAVGLAQLATLEGRIERLRRHYEIYAETLDNCPGIRLPNFDLADGACPQWTDIYVENGRDELHQHLKEQKMDCRKFWFPIHRQNAYKQDDKQFPNSIAVSNNAMWLPSSLNLTDEDISSVCHAIKSWAKSPQLAARS